MNKRENLIRRIKDTLAVYAVRIDMDKGEASREAEHFYCGLLNLLMGYELQNMNLVRSNYPAIDLGDEKAGLGIQVTSSATRKKVQDTLDAMFRNGVEQEYPHLVMLITNKWVESRKAFRMEGVCRFDPETDIWDTDWLLARIEGIQEPEKLEEIQKYLARHLHLVREPAPALNLPLQSGMAAKNFVGREEELRELAQRFEKEQIVVLSGLGGMGKTELAVRFGREYEGSGRGWAYFLHFSGSFSATLRSNVKGIIPGYSPEGKPEEQILADALAALNRCGKGDLLILDNADEGSITALRRELSKLPMRVLVTSRQESDDMMELGTLSEEALFAIFRRHGAELEEADMRELIKAVDGHTMTVELMARLLHKDQRKDTLSRLKKALGKRNLASGEFGKTESTYHASPDQARINEHLKAVFRVSDMGRAEKIVLRVATLIGESGLDSEMFVQAVVATGRNLVGHMLVTMLRTCMRDLLQELADKGWLLWKGNDIRIHPVIRLVCMEVLKKRDWAYQVFLYGLKIQYDAKQYNHVKFRQMAELFENAHQTLEDKTGFWAVAAGHFWSQVGEPGRALALEKRAAALREQHQPDSNALATAYNNLSLTYTNLGNHKQALAYQQKALGIRERVLPEDHPGLATSYNNVGYTYGNLGDHEQALAYQQKALEIRERVLPEDHPDLAQSYNNVGLAYGNLGNHKQALAYQQKALGICERVLPEDHPDLARSYNNVGGTYGDLGDHKQALAYQQKALEIWERVLPEDHPDLATSYNNVGCTYGDLGDHKQALEYDLKALGIWERVLPKDHPDLAQSYNNVGYSYGKLGDHKQALAYQQKALEIWERVLPEDHPDLATSYNNVGSAYGNLGDHERELEFKKKALGIRERVLSDNHPDLAMSCNNIACTYYTLGRLEEAAAYMRRAADIISRSALPENHPDRVDYPKWADRLEVALREKQAAAGE